MCWPRGAKTSPPVTSSTKLCWNLRRWVRATLTTQSNTLFFTLATPHRPKVAEFLNTAAHDDIERAYFAFFDRKGDEPVGWAEFKASANLAPA